MSSSFAVLCLVSSVALGQAAPKQDESRASLHEDLRAFVFGKLEYDASYFERVVRMDAAGTPPKGMTAPAFEKEVQRARQNLPVLQRFLEERANYASGKPLSLPGNLSAHREYANLLAILNMVQAYGAADFQRVLDFGSKVVVSDRQDLGQVREGDARYYVRLYRELYYLMGTANFRTGNDAEAVKWFARLEAETDLQQLKKQVATEGGAQTEKRDRLASLQRQTFVVMPLENLAQSKPLDWMTLGLMEVLTADLARHTDLPLLERQQLDKLLGEMELSRLGVTLRTHANDIGKLLNVSSMLVGSYLDQGDKVLLTLKLVDARDARVLGAISGPVPVADAVGGARRLMLELLREAGWLDVVAESEISAARAPKANTVRDLMEARALLATKSEDAKALYAKAMDEDPALANLFGDLKSQFSDVSATAALLPFVNVVGDEKDAWMVRGITEALSTDLPKLGFTVVERGRLDAILEQLQLERVTGNDSARKIGEQVGADFMLLGSLLHQSPQVRIDARLVEVKTGLILFTTSAEAGKDDFMGALAQLSKAMARSFDAHVSKKTLESLTATKMSKDEFEKYVRQELAQESLAKATAKQEAAKKESEVKKAPEGPSRLGFWISLGGAAIGSSVAATGYLLSSRQSGEATYFDVLRQVSVQQQDVTRYTGLRDQALSQAQTFRYVGHAGLGLAAVGLGFIVYDELVARPAQVRALQPSLAVTPDGASVGVSGRF